MNLEVEQLLDPTPDERVVEVVERKGLGHPDTLCDALAEEVSRALCRAYLDAFGQVLHHNVDKAILCGGRSAPRFGGGELTEPIEIDLAGRVTSALGGVELPVEELALEACRAWLRANLHALDPERHVRLRTRFRPGSAELVDLLARQPAGQAPLANDTSIGVGFAPRSRLERAVLEIEAHLNSPATRRAHPEVGEDIKVLGLRRGEATRLTIACAFVSAFVRDTEDYLAKKARVADEVRGFAARHLGSQVEVVVNAADEPARGSLYLTVTGTSAEAGDDGEVGRGNRVSGLITPGRPMTIEAAAGKNPVSHVGKLYSVAASLLAEELVSALPEISSTECQLTSSIGAPVDQPQLVAVRVRLVGASSVAELTPRIDEIARNHLRDLPNLAQRIIRGELRLY